MSPRLALFQFHRATWYGWASVSKIKQTRENSVLKCLGVTYNIVFGLGGPNIQSLLLFSGERRPPTSSLMTQDWLIRPEQKHFAFLLISDMVWAGEDFQLWFPIVEIICNIWVKSGTLWASCAHSTKTNCMNWPAISCRVAPDCCNWLRCAWFDQWHQTYMQQSTFMQWPPIPVQMILLGEHVFMYMYIYTTPIYIHTS